MQSGYIYILSNSAFRENLYKIGLTTRSAENRAYEIYTGATGVPAEFTIEYTHPVSNCAIAEKQVHNILHKHRFNEGREFFEVNLHVAKGVVQKVCEEVNWNYPTKDLPDAIEKKDWVVVTDIDGTAKTQLTKAPMIVVRQQSTSPNLAPASRQLPTEEGLLSEIEGINKTLLHYDATQPSPRVLQKDTPRTEHEHNETNVSTYRKPPIGLSQILIALFCLVFALVNGSLALKAFPVSVLGGIVFGAMSIGLFVAAFRSLKN